MMKKWMCMLLATMLCMAAAMAAANGATPALQGAGSREEAVELTLGEKTLGEMVADDDDAGVTYAVLDRVNTAAYLRDHAALDDARVHEFVNFTELDRGDQCVFILGVAHKSADVGEQDKVACIECHCDLCRCGICRRCT